MSAEEIVREIAPALARRRVLRGYLWLMGRSLGFPACLWAGGDQKYIPRERHEWQLHHILALVYRYPLHQRGMRITYDQIVKKYSLSPQFLLAHGFEPDHIITAPILNFVWREVMWIKDPPEAVAFVKRATAFKRHIAHIAHH